jgi:DNA-binding beta-propeller fold protein YncE
MKTKFLNHTNIAIVSKCWLLFVVAIIVATTTIRAKNRDNTFVPPEIIFETLALNRDIGTNSCPKYRSPSALTPSLDGRFLFVAEQTAKRISVIDLTSRKILKRILLPNEVTGIAVGAGNKLYATCSSDLWANGMVCEIDVITGRIVRRLSAGFGARSPVISPDGKSLYICNQFGNDVQLIDIYRGVDLMRLHTFHQPFASALTPDGLLLVVADCVPAGKSTDQEVAAKISLINTVEHQIDKVISLPHGSHSVFDVTISPDGAYAFVSHLVAIFDIQAAEVEGGYVHTNNIAIIDLKNRRLLNDFPLDDANLGAPNPWEISCTKDGSLLCVAQAGSNELTTIELPKMLQIAINRSNDVVFENNLKFTGCTHDFFALSAIKSRISILGRGPRTVTIIGKMAFTAGYFGDSTGRDYVEVFNLAPGKKAVKRAGKISLGSPIPLNGLRKGEQAYYDATLCHQYWQSCSSCHPFARSDGLNWILGRDPTNTFKNAKSMVYSWWTPPTQWSGKRVNAAESIRLGFVNSLFSEINYELATYIDTFLMRIQPVSSPYLVKGKLSIEAANGKNVYFNNPNCDCRKCHIGPLYTDLLLHPSSIPFWWDPSHKWDTPTIIETWRDPPYGHLGTFDQVEDIIKYKGHSESLKNGLTEEELRDLVKFVLSL